MLTPARIAAATDGFRAVYLKAYEGTSPNWLPIAMEVTSTSETETYEFLSGLPGMREMIGEAKASQLASAGFSIRNKEWESTVEVKRSTIERDALGLVKPQMAELGTIAREHPGLLVADLLNNGFTALDYTRHRVLRHQQKARSERRFQRCRHLRQQEHRRAVRRQFRRRPHRHAQDGQRQGPQPPPGQEAHAGGPARAGGNG